MRNLWVSFGTRETLIQSSHSHAEHRADRRVRRHQLEPDKRINVLDDFENATEAGLRLFCAWYCAKSCYVVMTWWLTCFSTEVNRPTICWMCNALLHIGGLHSRSRRMTTTPAQQPHTYLRIQGTKFPLGIPSGRHATGRHDCDEQGGCAAHTVPAGRSERLRTGNSQSACGLGRQRRRGRHSYTHTRTHTCLEFDNDQKAAKKHTHTHTKSFIKDNRCRAHGACRTTNRGSPVHARSHA